MDEQQILHVYERVSGLTTQMLAAARLSQWERLVTLEKDCSALFAPLFEHDREPPAGAEYRARKAGLLRRILDDDAQIRLLVEPWLANLSAALGVTQQERRLLEVYQAGA